MKRLAAALLRAAGAAKRFAVAALHAAGGVARRSSGSWKPAVWSAPVTAKKTIVGANRVPRQRWILRIGLMVDVYR